MNHFLLCSSTFWSSNTGRWIIYRKRSEPKYLLHPIFRTLTHLCFYSQKDTQQIWKNKPVFDKQVSVNHSLKPSPCNAALKMLIIICTLLCLAGFNSEPWWNLSCALLLTATLTTSWVGFVGGCGVFFVYFNHSVISRCFSHHWIHLKQSCSPHLHNLI